VSQLTGFPFPIGGARTFPIDPRTGVVKTYARGFTNAMDLAFGPDGTPLLSPDTAGAILAGRKTLIVPNHGREKDKGQVLEVRLG
jgi:hypothetical protein